MDEIIANDPRALAALRDAVEQGIALEPYAFARLIGRPEYTVSKAWKNGQLPSEAGCIPVRAGLVAVVSCGGLRRDKKPVPSFICDAEKRARELLGLPPRDDTPQSEGEGSSAEIAAWRLKYLKAQTAARTAAAQAKQMENELAKGQLVKAAEVELDAAETATNIAGVLSRIPERAAGMCVGCSAEEIAAILRKEISLALDAIQASAFTGDWSGVL